MSKMDNDKRIEAACELKKLHASPRSSEIAPEASRALRMWSQCGRSGR